MTGQYYPVTLLLDHGHVAGLGATATVTVPFGCLAGPPTERTEAASQPVLLGARLPLLVIQAAAQPDAQCPAAPVSGRLTSAGRAGASHWQPLLGSCERRPAAAAGTICVCVGPPGVDSEPAAVPPGAQWHATPGLSLALALSSGHWQPCATGTTTLYYMLPPGLFTASGTIEKHVRGQLSIPFK